MITDRDELFAQDILSFYYNTVATAMQRLYDSRIY